MHVWGVRAAVGVGSGRARQLVKQRARKQRKLLRAPPVNGRTVAKSAIIYIVVDTKGAATSTRFTLVGFG